MKKVFILLLITVFLFISCTKKSSSEKISITCSSVSIYKITNELLKNIEGIEVSLITTPDYISKKFIPSSKQIVEILNSDLFIYFNSQAETWIKPDILNYCKNYLPLVKNLNYKNTLKKEKNHILEKISDSDFYFLSPSRCLIPAQKIKEKIISIYMHNTDDFEKLHEQDLYKKINENFISFNKKINFLNTEYYNLAARLENPVIFAGAFAFKSLFSDYKISYECLTEDQLSYSEYSYIQFSKLVNLINLNSIKYIFITWSDEKDNAERIINSTKTKNQKYLQLKIFDDPSENNTENVSYYSDIISYNLDQLKKINF